MIGDVVTGVALAVAVVAIEQLLAFIRRRRRAPPNWEARRLADHLIDVTPKNRRTTWPKSLR